MSVSLRFIKGDIKQTITHNSGVCVDSVSSPVCSFLQHLGYDWLLDSKHNSVFAA